MSINPDDLSPGAPWRPANIDDDGSHVWALTDIRPDGTYGITIQFDQDRVLALEADEVDAYVHLFAAAAERSEYDAAVLRQFTGFLNITLPDATAEVQELRKERSALMLQGLTVTPGVTNDGTDDKPKFRSFITMHLDGKPVGQFTSAQAYDHGIHVVGAAETAQLDYAYFRHLVDVINLDENRARQVVQDLGRFR